jgi:UDP-glucose 4-epimerase
MSRILITGASGFIGKALARELSQRNEVICLSRKDPELGLTWVQGDFTSLDDLKKLDTMQIDTVVHLGGVTGGCSEKDGLLVNVEGTRTLMRYLIDSGCKRFVMASSIAVVGLQSTQFRPLELPITEQHTCLDRDGYGLSKFLMEEVTKYYSRQNPEIDVINLRLAAICPDDAPPPLMEPSSPMEWGPAAITMMYLSDAVRAFQLAAEASFKTGCRILNAASPQAWTAKPVSEVLKSWWNDDVSLSYYSDSERAYDSVFDVSMIEKELDFVAKHLPQRKQT